MKHCKALLIIVLAVALSACGRLSFFNGQKELALDSIGAEINDSTVFVGLHIFYPTDGPAELVKSVRQYIALELRADTALFADGQALIDGAARQEFERLKAQRSEVMADFELDETDEFDYHPSYEPTFDITKLAETDNYLTLNTMSYEFLGGAHGSTFVSGATFSKLTGKQKGWDLLTDTESAAFRQLILRGIRSYFEDGTEEPLSDEDFEGMLQLEHGLAEIPLPQAPPYLMPDGVAFVYQQYEIACYAAGLPSFTISYDDIRPFLSPEAIELIATPQEKK